MINSCLFLLLGTFVTCIMAECSPFDTSCNVEKIEPGTGPITADIYNGPTDCYDIYYMEGNKTDGLYVITPRGYRSINVLCRFDLDGQWTILQQRLDGQTDFQRSWCEYEWGFGSMSLSTNFWLGLSHMSALTAQHHYTLRVDLVGERNREYYAEYKWFKLGDADAHYDLNWEFFDGNAGDGFQRFHNRGTPFSTFDEDNAGGSYNCALFPSEGGWWYIKTSENESKCTHSNLNAKYSSTRYGNLNAIHWGQLMDIRKTMMRVRRTFNDSSIPFIH